MLIAITGSTGLLGRALTAAIEMRGWQHHALDRTLFLSQTAHSAASVLNGVDVVIHAAANTNVEQCEIAPDACYRDNYLLSEQIGVAANAAGVPVCFISSTGVYGEHASTPYCEFAAAEPTTHHHRSKLLAENRLLQLCAANLVIRTGWLFGGDITIAKNFVARRIEEANAALTKTGRIQSNAQQRGVPCYSRDVAERILLLIEQNRSGLFNCVNNGNASRYEYVKAIVECARIPITVEPSQAATFNRNARVSDNEMALNWKMDHLGLPPMPDWNASLATYVDAIAGNF